MSKDNRTLPGGFLRPEHVARKGSEPGNSATPIPYGDGPSSTPPPDSSKAFDPYRFGAYTVPPSLRMELISIEVPDTPEDQLFHPPPIEEPKASSPVVESANAAAPRSRQSAAGLGALLRRPRFEVVLGGLAVVAGLGVVLLQRSCGESSADVATVNAARASVVASSPPKPTFEASATLASPLAHPSPSVPAKVTAPLPPPSAKPDDLAMPVAPARKRTVVAATPAPVASTTSAEQVPAASVVPSVEPQSPSAPPKSQSIFDTKMRPPID